VRARLVTLPQYRKVQEQHSLVKRKQLLLTESVENILGSGATTNQPEGVISGLYNFKRKMDKIDRERELFKAEHAKLEDEVSSVTNSLSKLGDEIIAMERHDKTQQHLTVKASGVQKYPVEHE
jgi:hypothetical protein